MFQKRFVLEPWPAKPQIGQQIACLSMAFLPPHQLGTVGFTTNENEVQPIDVLLQPFNQLKKVIALCHCFQLSV
ncbi:hypothetical protein JCM18905_3553 [Vibrio sp. JCM 18905]|nr:hypothetical protein JCM18905_3553 [Vibrio sp. JCM 18905]